MKWWLLAVTAIFFITPAAIGRTYRIIDWEKQDHHIICMIDHHHQAISPNDKKQRADISHVTKTLDAVVIAEDMAYDATSFAINPLHYNANRIAIIDPTIFSDQNCLTGLTHSCRSIGVDAKNCEFRFAHQLSCRQWPNDPFISANQAHIVTQQALKEITGYYDCPFLYAYYQAAYNQYLHDIYQPCQKLIDAFKNETEEPISTMLPAIVYDKKFDRIFYNLKKRAYQALDPQHIISPSIAREYDCAEKLAYIALYYNRDLLHLRILHQIWRHRDKKYIIICAGSVHMGHLANALPLLGYRKVNSVGENLTITNNHHINEPTAINIISAMQTLLPETFFTFYQRATQTCQATLSALAQASYSLVTMPLQYYRHARLTASCIA